MTCKLGEPHLVSAICHLLWESFAPLDCSVFVKMTCIIIFSHACHVLQANNDVTASLKQISSRKIRTYSQCISERMQNRRLRNGQTFTGARAFSRQKCFVQFFIQNCTLRMYCYIGLACPSTIFQNTIIYGMEAL